MAVSRSSPDRKPVRTEHTSASARLLNICIFAGFETRQALRGNEGQTRWHELGLHSSGKAASITARQAPVVWSKRETTQPAQPL